MRLRHLPVRLRHRHPRLYVQPAVVARHGWIIRGIIHYRGEDYLRCLFGGCFEIVRLQRYTEMEENDSVYVIADVKNSHD